MTPQIPQWAAWLVTLVLIEAAVIDGLRLKVPNWLTYHFALGGLAFATYTQGFLGLQGAFTGMLLGLALLLPLHMIGGMGAGDVKLLAGIGAWVGPSITAGAFVVSAVVGGLMAIVMVIRSGNWIRHLTQFQTIVREIVSVRDPVKLSEIAAARKPSMMLLPYGIPIAIGSICYLMWLGLLI